MQNICVNWITGYGWLLRILYVSNAQFSDFKTGGAYIQHYAEIQTLPEMGHIPNKNCASPPPN